MLAWQELGAKACTLYIEDDADNMAELLAAPLAVPRRVLMYGGVPVITTKIRIKDVKGDAPLVSDRGDGYIAAVQGWLTVITPTTAVFPDRVQAQAAGDGLRFLHRRPLPAAGQRLAPGTRCLFPGDRPAGNV